MEGFSSLKKGVAKKILFSSGPVGTSSDIASKRGFFVSLFECKRKVKGFVNELIQWYSNSSGWFQDSPVGLTYSLASQHLNNPW
jgi:hypothetical protein